MSDFKTIVIGTSLIEPSEAVVRTAAAAARATGASAWLLHAYLPPAYGTELVSSSWLESQAEALLQLLGQQARRAGLTDLPGWKPEHLRLVVGSPAREITNLARQVKADLLVVGAEDGGTLHRILVGSTADGVLRHAPCPVLVVRPDSAFPPTRVEIPVDLSPVSAHAMRTGLDFLDKIGTPRTETEALFVLSPFEMGGSLHFKAPQIERFAQEELRRFMAENGTSRPPYRARICVGYPREEIRRVLDERRVDLAILGTQGKSLLERLAIGSVAADIMHQAACNLLLVPPEPGTWSDDLAQQPPKSADWTYVSDEDPVAAERSAAGIALEGIRPARLEAASAAG